MPRAKRPKLPLVPQAALPLHQPFAGLAQLQAKVRAAPGPPEQTAAVARPQMEQWLRDCRARLHHERKGHGGKTVTLLSLTGLPAQLPIDACLDELCICLRRRLGCGAGREAETIVLQGDQRQAAARLLQGMGLRQVAL
ncbi:MAG: translation initiation factor [Deltaproteobacteria bacterium]|nr:MAG: translation initiation factor [Deltaproteobacteria bacterium]